MIEWILQNRDWVFSGIGVAILAGLVALAKRLLRRSPPNSQLPAEMPLQVVIDSVPTMPMSLPSAATAIDPMEIISAIEAAPFLQQSDIEKHYLGIEVEWNGRLLSAAKHQDDKVGLVLGSPGPGSDFGVAFDVDPTRYPGLGLLRKGDMIRVAGVIDKIVCPVILLRDVRLVAYGKKAI